MRRLALALCLTAGPLSAQQPPETVPLPEARPEGLVEEATPDAAEAGAAGEAGEAGEAPESDGDQAETGAETETEADTETEPETETDGGDTAVTPDANAAAREVVPAMPERLAAPASARDACRAELTALGAEFEEGTPIDDPEIADCGIAHPLTLSEILPGVTLDPPAPMRCETALALARWVEGFAAPAAERLGRGGLDAIRQGTVYNCRSRSSDAETLSEHAFGNAVDIMSFGFADGSEVRVQPREREGTMAEAFQDAVRATACLDFTTVLGPGSDAAHADHLHLDVKARRGDFRLCQ